METHRFYDRISKAYDLIADRDEHVAREAGARALGLAAGERVLEIGCGTGNGIVGMAHSVGETGRVVGLDLSSGMLGVTRDKVEAERLAGRVTLELGDARRLPHAAAAFDAVFASFTLELFSDEEIPLVLAEIARVLRAGGRLAVVAMAEVKAGDHPSLLERAYLWMHRHFPHIVDCRPIDVRRVVAAAGFEVARCDELEIWTMPVAIVVARKPV